MNSSGFIGLLHGNGILSTVFYMLNVKNLLGIQTILSLQN